MTDSTKDFIARWRAENPPTQPPNADGNWTRKVDVETALEMYGRGMTVAEIADHFDVWPDAVRRVIRRAQERTE